MLIVGAGALGLLHAARLAQSGEEVVVLARTDKQAETLSRDGILYQDLTGREQRISVSAWSVGGYLASGTIRASAPDWLLLAVKQPNVEETLLDELRQLTQGGVPVLALQNGIGHMEPLREALPDSLVCAAITTEGALRTDLRTVIHTGAGQLTFGSWTPNSTNTANAQKMLLHALKGAGIQANLSNDMENQVYLKLLVNAVINPLTAIFQVKNGELPRDSYRLKLMRALHDESALILRAAGLNTTEDLWGRLLDLCAATAANESSMLRDVRAGRQTEIHWINGGIAAHARRLGLQSEMNDAMIALVRALHDS